ncbi:hypothetical protein [Ilumatobacter sp.]|uniref:hypothetical protein n=1 Tax=Ilumatobacter sp. TaxID=1967498 RepID=UPI003C377C78
MGKLDPVRDLVTGHEYTLIDLDDIARVTIDSDLRCADEHGRSVGLTDRFVLETESTSAPGATDRYLWRLGIRPEKISTYDTGPTAPDPSLVSNKWNRMLRRHFDR